MSPHNHNLSFSEHHFGFAEVPGSRKRCRAFLAPSLSAAVRTNSDVLEFGRLLKPAAAFGANQSVSLLRDALQKKAAGNTLPL
jgi:hypothetical protein